MPNGIIRQTQFIVGKRTLERRHLVERVLVALDVRLSVGQDATVTTREIFIRQRTRMEFFHGCEENEE